MQLLVYQSCHSLSVTDFPFYLRCGCFEVHGFSLGTLGGCLCDLSMHARGGGATRPGLPIDLNLFAEALSSSTALFVCVSRCGLPASDVGAVVANGGALGDVLVLFDLSCSALGAPVCPPMDPSHRLCSSPGRPLSPSVSGTSASGALTIPRSLLVACSTATSTGGVFDPLLFADTQPFSLSEDIRSSLKADLARPPQV